MALTAKLQFYLSHIPGSSSELLYDGIVLDAEKLIYDIDLDLERLEDYDRGSPPPVLTFVEWTQ